MSYLKRTGLLYLLIFHTFLDESKLLINIIKIKPVGIISLTLPKLEHGGYPHPQPTPLHLHVLTQHSFRLSNIYILNNDFVNLFLERIIIIERRMKKASTNPYNTVD